MQTANQLDLISIGDSTIDTFIKIHDARVECDINQQDCKICFAYGSKIPVDGIAYGVAGDAANVAVGVAKLGFKSAIYTNLGDDTQGKTILEAFEKEGVNTKYVKVDPDKKSNLSVVLTFQGERTIFVYHQDWSYHLPNLEKTSWVYLTSMAETFTNSNIMNEVVNFVEKTQAKLVYCPGTYQLKADVKRYPRILERCEALIVNLEEAKRILGIAQTQMSEVRDLVAGLLLLGPKKIVITDGANGSYAADGHTNLKIGAVPTEVVERTGAGDAYASGFLAALIAGHDMGEAMVWGAINAASVIGHIGTQVGLLGADALKKQRQELKLKPVEF